MRTSGLAVSPGERNRRPGVAPVMENGTIPLPQVNIPRDKSVPCSSKQVEEQLHDTHIPLPGG